MLTLLGGIALLVLGYFTYGRYIEKNFSIDPERTTPAEALKDGYDLSRCPNQKMPSLNC
jgi:carbon starvation protein CstA